MQTCPSDVQWGETHLEVCRSPSGGRNDGSGAEVTDPLSRPLIRIQRGGSSGAAIVRRSENSCNQLSLASRTLSCRWHRRAEGRSSGRTPNRRMCFMLYVVTRVGMLYVVTSGSCACGLSSDEIEGGG